MTKLTTILSNSNCIVSRRKWCYARVCIVQCTIYIIQCTCDRIISSSLPEVYRGTVGAEITVNVVNLNSEGFTGCNKLR